MRSATRTRSTFRRRLSSPGLPLEPLEQRSLLSFSLSATGSEVLNRTDGITSTVAFDYDAGGRQDLLVASGREVLLLRGDGAGRFQPARSLIRLAAETGLLAVDPDSTPGNIRLLAAQISSAYSGALNFRELVPTAGGGLKVRTHARLVGKAVSITPIRTSDTGPVDIVLHSRQAAGPSASDGTRDTIVVLRRDTLASGRRAFLPFTPPITTTANERFATPGAADLDNDGISEIVTALNTGAEGGLDTATTIRIYGLQGGELALRAEQTAIGWITQVALADLDRDGVTEAVFGRFRTYLVAPFARRAAQTIETVPILASGFGPAASLTLASTRVLVDRTADLVSDDRPTRDHRVIGVHDMNGDARPDVVVSSIVGFGFGPSPTFVSRIAVLSQLVQRADGTFADVTVFKHSTSVDVFTQVVDVSFLDLTQPFTVVGVRGTGRPDVISLRRPPQLSLNRQPGLGSSALDLHRTISAFRRPSVLAMDLVRRFSPITSGGLPRYQAFEGDLMRVTADVRVPDASRFVGVGSVRLFLDSNANGRFDTQDALIGEGRQVTAIGGGSLTVSFPGASRWAIDFIVGPWDLGQHTMFVQVTDTRGVSADPNLSAPVITLR